VGSQVVERFGRGVLCRRPGDGQLAQRGFGEEELRKLLGLNFLRVFREVVG